MTAEVPPRASSVQSVDRALDLLELITDAGGEIMLSTLAQQSQLPMPTIHRLLRTLVTNGYLHQLANRRYVLGPRLIRVGEAASRQFGSLARSRLLVVAEQLGETANLAVLDSDMALYIAQAPSRRSVRMFTEVGRRVHTHDSGVGKAILAQLDASAVRAIVAKAGMPRPTTATIGTIEELLAELDTIRSRGYAVDNNEQEVGVRCYAVAVPDAPIPSAISVSGPDSRVDEPFGLRAVPLLHEAAMGIASDLRLARVPNP